VKKPSNLRNFIDSNPPIHYLVVRLLRWKGRNSPCVFCEIIASRAPERVLYRDDLVTAFRDAHPAASTHILIVPNRHIESLNDLTPGDESLCGHMLLVAQKLTRAENIHTNGYCLTINTGLHAGQTVFHLHLHLRSTA
jgi:histidine triad (HIT) family protein